MILDVGCGDRPQGTVNVDLALSSEELYFEERRINPKQIPNFVKADAHYLPFKTACFQKVFCIHTLEHLSKPVIAIKEMLRVANGKCMIRVPARSHEQIQCFFVPQRRIWVKKYHRHSFTRSALLDLMPNFKIHYSYHVFSVIHGLKQIRKTTRNFLKYLFYSFGSTFFPPTPDEIVASL